MEVSKFEKGYGERDLGIMQVMVTVNNKATVSQQFKTSQVISGIGNTLTYGPDRDETNGLNLEERKRRRSELYLYGPNEGGLVSRIIVDGDTEMETTLSTTDCAASLPFVLAK